MEFSLYISFLFSVFLLFPTLNLATLSPASPNRCYEDDQKVLLEIKTYFKNASLFSTWTTETDCCNKWSGVSCKKIPKTIIHRVNFLEIDGGIDVVGTVPSLVADLPYLETLIFRSLPNLTGPIPPAIAKLKDLNFVLLNWNNIAGPIPSFISQLTKLSTFEMNDNHLTGPIPSFLGRLANLGSLNLANNHLSGTIPASLGSMVPGSLLTLSNNMLSGPIPATFGKVNFEILDLSSNRLTGDASFLFGEDKTNLAHLQLVSNQLSFDLSNVVMPVGQLNSSLLVLDLSHNMIYGRLPTWLGQAPVMYEFDVSYNQLCGPIPTAGGKLQSFDASSFSNNKCLCGAPLPPCKS